MDNNELKTNYGIVRNISDRKIKNKILKNIVKTTIATASIITIMTLTGCALTNDYVVPEDQIKYNISMQVEEGDTVSEIAEKFFSHECEVVYNSFYNYKDEIYKENKISKITSDISAGQTIEIPVIIDKNDPYYLRILEIENEISNITSNELWVKYIVQYGDRLYTIAEKASGDPIERLKIENEIASKNNIQKKSILNAGEEIWIMNPELGILKADLYEAKEDLKLSLIGGQLKK